MLNIRLFCQASISHFPFFFSDKRKTTESEILCTFCSFWIWNAIYRLIIGKLDSKI